MHFKFVSLIWVIFAFTPIVAHSAGTCRVFSGAVVGMAPVVAPLEVRFTQYLGFLIQEKRLISIEDLERFIAQTRATGKIVNPISPDSADINSVLFIHHRTLQEYIDLNMQDQELILAWAQSQIEKMQQVQVDRNVAQTETQDDVIPMRFHPLPPSSFLAGPRDNLSQLRQVTLTNWIEVMATPVSQSHWINVMRSNCSHFVMGDFTKTINIDGRDVQSQPNHPAENMSWWSALVFANAVSKLHGLTPAYDLSGIRFFELPKSTLTPRVLRNEDEIFQVAARGRLGAFNESTFPKINAPNGDIHAAEGFRLPTSVELEYFFRKAGMVEEPHPFGDRQNITNFVWIDDNAHGKTQLLSALEPLVIEGHHFSDVMGNVGIWSHDSDRDAAYFQMSTNPVSKNRSEHRIAMGAGFRAGLSLINAARTSSVRSNNRFSVYGLRLVRTIPKPGP